MNNRNQLANSKNMYQNPAKRVLTVCSAGLLRSPTIAEFLIKEKGFNCRACGVVEEYALVPITEVLIFWADQIVFAEDNHLWTAQAMFTNENIWENTEILVLNVPDAFERNDPTLIRMITKAYEEKTA